MVGTMEWLDHPAKLPIQSAVDCFRALSTTDGETLLIGSRSESEVGEQTRQVLDRLHTAWPGLELRSFECFACLDEQYGGDFIALAQGEKYSFGIDEVAREINRHLRITHAHRLTV